MQETKIVYKCTLLRCLECHSIWEAVLVKRPGSKFFLYAQPKDVRCPQCGGESLSEA